MSKESLGTLSKSPQGIYQPQSPIINLKNRPGLYKYSPSRAKLHVRKDGYTHIDGHARQWSFHHRLALAPWIRARTPSDPDRGKVLSAIERARPEELRDLFGDASFASRILLESQKTSAVDRWATEVLLPWAADVQSKNETR